MAWARTTAAIVAGFALLAAVDAVALVVAVPVSPGGGALRAAALLVDAAETIGVGALLALAVGAFTHFVRLPRWAMATVGIAVTIAITWWSLGEFLQRIATQVLDGRFETLVFAGYLALFGVGLVDAVRMAAGVADRPRMRWAPVAIAVVGLALDQGFLRDDYFALHGIVATAAALVGGAGLGAIAERAGRRLAGSPGGRGTLASLALFAIVGLAWPPPNALRLELFRQPCAVAPWVLATAVWRAPRPHEPVVLAPSRWNDDRSRAPAVPPTTPPALPPNAVVVLITIDAVRGDVVGDPANDARLPTLAAMKRDGVFFPHASAPATQTPVSLGTLFSGLYFSEQTWALHGRGSTRYLYPAVDASPRFPELLSSHGVATASFGGLTFLAGEYGVLRGFREESVVVEGRRHAQAKELIGPLLDRLARARAGDGPLFLYTHLMDPHWPYDRGQRQGSDFDRYVSEVAVADAAVGEVLSALAARFGDRWALFVGADHGEAFGEHGTTGHAKTLYEELLHVPLLARSPRFPAHTVGQRVGLIDLGPTILDLFGVPTPATFEGQSLVPLLAGGAATLTRPLLAEGRLRRAITEPDGFKVIDDPRRKVVEAYDLAVDPAETTNLWDSEPARARSRSDRALAELRAFFAARTRPGYELPYEP